MKARVKILMLVAVVALGVLGFIPAHAAGQAACVSNATVTLSTNENLSSVDGGAGSLSGSIQCVGDVAGSAAISGPFSFCRHTAATHGTQCTDKSDESITEPVYDNAATALGPASQLVAHVNGSISFRLDTGVSCSFSLNGHTLGTVAELEMKAFKCSNGFGGTTGAETARSQAASEIIINPNLTCPPGPAPLCFNTLTFQGLSEIIDQ